MWCVELNNNIMKIYVWKTDVKGALSDLFISYLSAIY